MVKPGSAWPIYSLTCFALGSAKSTADRLDPPSIHKLPAVAKAFFSHASEDKGTVEAVYRAFVAAYPEHQAWVDKYEILGGDSLIDKIAEGMDEAKRFFTFLSSISIEKPWVQAELKRAIMREIDGVDPGHIVPVKIGDLDAIPPFLEDKLYIDLGKLKEADWLAEFHAAMTGERPEPTGKASPNIRWRAVEGPEGPHVAHVCFEAQAWAEQFSFFVETSEDMVEESGSVTDVWPGGSIQDIRIERGPRVAALSYGQPGLRPGKPEAIRLEFPHGVDALQAIERVGRWD
jgi:TIR domain